MPPVMRLITPRLIRSRSRCSRALAAEGVAWAILASGWAWAGGGRIGAGRRSGGALRRRQRDHRAQLRRCALIRRRRGTLPQLQRSRIRLSISSSNQTIPRLLFRVLVRVSFRLCMLLRSSLEFEPVSLPSRSRHRPWRSCAVGPQRFDSTALTGVICECFLLCCARDCALDALPKLKRIKILGRLILRS